MQAVIGTGFSEFLQDQKQVGTSDECLGPKWRQPGLEVEDAGAKEQRLAGSRHHGRQEGGAEQRSPRVLSRGHRLAPARHQAAATCGPGSGASAAAQPTGVASGGILEEPHTPLGGLGQA